MIFWDRVLRYFNKDINLPSRCYADIQKKLNPCFRCECKIFCREIKRGKPAFVFNLNKHNNRNT